METRDARVALSPNMLTLVREALGMKGWSVEAIDELMISGVLAEPVVKVRLDADLLAAFETAVAQVMETRTGGIAGRRKVLKRLSQHRLK